LLISLFDVESNLLFAGDLTPAPLLMKERGDGN